MRLPQIKNFVYESADVEVQKAIDKWLSYVQEAGNWKVRKKRMLDVVDAIGLIFFKAPELSAFVRQIGEAVSKNPPSVDGEFRDETQEIIKVIEREASSTQSDPIDEPSVAVEVESPVAATQTGVDPLEKLLTEIDAVPMDAVPALSPAVSQSDATAPVSAERVPTDAGAPQVIVELLGEDVEPAEDEEPAEEDAEQFPFILTLYITAILEKLGEAQISCAEQAIFYLLSMHKEHQEAVAAWLQGNAKNPKSFRKLIKSDRRAGLLMTLALDRMESQNSESQNSESQNSESEPNIEDDQDDAEDDLRL